MAHVGTITVATLTYTADGASRIYRAANPALGGTTTGFVGSDILANATTGSAAFTTLATTPSNVGSYLISGSGLAASKSVSIFSTGGQRSRCALRMPMLLLAYARADGAKLQMQI